MWSFNFFSFIHDLEINETFIDRIKNEKLSFIFVILCITLRCCCYFFFFSLFFFSIYWSMMKILIVKFAFNGILKSLLWMYILLRVSISNDFAHLLFGPRVILRYQYYLIRWTIFFSRVFISFLPIFSIFPPWKFYK